MAKKPVDLVGYAQALLGWPIVVGAQVITTATAIGCDNDDREHTLAPGAEAEVASIEWRGDRQRLAITLAIPVAPDLQGDPNGITAIFDESDKPDGWFAFVPDTSPREKTFDVDVRAIIHCTKTLRISAASQVDAEALAEGQMVGGEVLWDLSLPEDEQIESVRRVS